MWLVLKYLFTDGHIAPWVRELPEPRYSQNKLRRRVVQCGGKNEMKRKMSGIIGPLLEREERCAVLVMRDRDADETPMSIRDSMGSIFQHTLNSSRHIVFQPCAEWKNVSSFVSAPPELPHLHVVLHIAHPCPTLNGVLDGYPFNNATTDDYILASALTEGVLRRFASRAGVDSATLRQRVTHEIPALLRQQQKYHLDAKNLNAVYMTVTRFAGFETREIFAEAVIARVIKYAPQAFEQIFASLIAAIRMLTETEQQS